MNCRKTFTKLTVVKFYKLSLLEFKSKSISRKFCILCCYVSDFIYVRFFDKLNLTYD